MSETSSKDKIIKTVTNAINDFFSTPNMNCQILNMTEPQNREKDNQIRFINLLNEKIKNNSIFLYDINSKIKNNINSIKIKDDNKIIYTYTNGIISGSSNYKEYEMNISLFLKSIIICNNKIFLLPKTFTYNSELTTNFNSRTKEHISIEDIITIFNTPKRKSSFVVSKISPYSSNYSGKALATISRSNIKEVLQKSENIFKERSVIAEISRSKNYKTLNSTMSINDIDTILEQLIKPYITDRRYRNIKFNVVFKRLRDNILMAPPEPRPTKRSRLGGNNKILRRKIYIDDNGKLFIKLNKYTIIDLYK